MIAGEGLDAVITTEVEEFMIMAQAAIEELKSDAGKDKADQLPIDKRIAMMTPLADAVTKMTASAGKLAPKVSELGLAQYVILRLIEFVKEHYPEHAPILLQLSEPFGPGPQRSPARRGLDGWDAGFRPARGTPGPRRCAAGRHARRQLHALPHQGGRSAIGIGGLRRPGA